MKGKSNKELGAIDVELKEAVCDSLVNALVARVAGADERGRNLLGGSPRRGIFAGQLLPRFDVTGQDDETTDIRVAAVGVDLMASAGMAAPIRVAPRFSVYLRVIPNWADLAAGGGELDFDFRLRANIQQQIDDAIRTERAPALQAAGVDRPDWKGMDETKRAKVRAARAQILAEVRRKAYAAHGIKLLSGDAEPDADAKGDADQADTNPNTPNDIKPPIPPIARLVREGRELPLNLVDPAPIPGKWTRLDLDLPALEFELDATDDALASAVEAYNRSLGEAIGAQLEAWVVGTGAGTAWRDVTVQPGDTLTEEKWNLAMAGLAVRQVDRNRILPDMSRVVVKVERQPDFLDASALSMRVMLDNQSAELTPPDARGRCNTVFGAGLTIELPNDAHRPLRLDRVEPSYRFREHLQYPAIGLNCGVDAYDGGPTLSLRTTCAPRFAQPRIVARNIDLPFQFALLRDPGFDASRLLALPRAYAKWIDEQEIRLRDTVTAGLEPADAAIEAARVRKDIASQRAEARYIERGVELLIASKKAADALATGGGDRRSLELRAAPWRAWTMTNEAFALRDAFDAKRGWRLFQMAFVLAHVPVFASRMDEWREAHDPLLDEDGVSLLYFPTGGGKSEAFYGTLLFAMFLDRLRGKDRGITAMIRYPLRLLTLQQAQRLLKLVVRAEMVRKKHSIGSWPFEMGFWVGSQNTPNHYNAFKAEIPLSTDHDHPDDRDLDGETGDDEQRDRARRYIDAREAFDKIPECPVCGSQTGLRRDETDGHYGRRATILCFNDACDWNRAHGGRHPLPFLLTDDAVYARAPSIVLGTVDKLAMLGQNTGTISKVLGMFGLARRIDAHGNLDNPRSEADLKRDPATEHCSNVFPAYANGKRVFHDPFPSLIIQDEAHLLEESLGTFSGLFDTLLDTALEDIADMAGDGLAVARRWTGDGWSAPRMPKIIAATATISAPERQLETLYQRIPLRFPYPGPDLYHSFFAEPADPPKDNADRVELAKSLPFAQVPEATAPWMRLYVSLMTNDATHTVTTVGVLAAFHGIVTALWDGMMNDTRRTQTIASVRASVSPGRKGDWHRAAVDRAVDQGREAEILALIDLHRIALAYVTNKKGGDQVIDALGAAVEQEHRRIGRAHAAFDSRLISGGIEMKEIQSVMEAADRSFAGTDYPNVAETVRNIVATSAISHGVDVDRFNSMFFAGLPSDIAEYIQASSRVGRTHVGFVMLLPTPQNRRDRYVVETHDIFHRFLERMIAPPAVERWAENAIRRAMASYVQAWAMLREARDFIVKDDDRKFEVAHMDQVSRLSAMEQRDHLAFTKELVAFMLRASGFAGKGANSLGSPHYEEFYRGLVDKQVENFARDISGRNTISSLRDYWTDIPVFKPPMTSLRDVDEAGYIVAAMRDPLAKGRTADVDRRDLAKVMKAIRTQRGTASELDADGGSNG